MSSFTIRQYKTEDTEQIKELYRIASIQSEIGYRDGPWYKDFDDIENYYLDGGDFLVGLLGDVIVAIVGLQKITISEAHIRRMRVHPEHRRKGYGLQILVELEKRAQQSGFTDLRLRTSTQQKMAQALYEKDGYIKMDTQKEYYTEGGGNTFEVVWYRKLFL